MGLENLAAGQPEIIRSQQKDEYVKSILKNDLAAVVVALFGELSSFLKKPQLYTNFFNDRPLISHFVYFSWFSGPKTLIKYEEEIASLSRLCYVYFTTAFGKWFWKCLEYFKIIPANIFRSPLF